MTNLMWEGPEDSLIGRWVAKAKKKQSLQIIECTRCQAPQVFDGMNKIPEALEVNLNGGYGMFYDNWNDDEHLKMMLCHKCAHEFVNWLGQSTIGYMGHPNTDEPFCNGWRIND